MLVFMLVFLALNDLFIFLFDPNQGTTLYGTRTVLCHLFWRYDLTAGAAVLHVQHLAEIFCRAAGGHSVHFGHQPQ